jgi:hypothetical protein
LSDVVFDSVTLKSNVRPFSTPTAYISNVYLLNPQAVVFRDCNIYMKTVAVQLETSADKRTRDSLCSILFENCEFKYNANVANTGLDGYAYINTAGNVPGVHVRDCVFEPARCRAMVRLFESSDGTDANGSFNAVISQSRFLKNFKPLVSAGDANGIFFRGDSSVIRDNYFYNLEGNFIDYQRSGDFAATNEEAGNKGVLIAGNTIKLDASGDFKNDGIIHARLGGTIISNNFFYIDWTGSSFVAECVKAKWGESCSIESNEFNVVGNSTVLELESSQTYPEEAKAYQVKNNVFRSPSSATVSTIRINTNSKALYADISGNVFDGVTSALRATTNDSGGGFVYPKVRFVGNTGYTNPMAFTGLIDWQEVDGPFNYTITLDPSTGALNPSSTIPFTTLQQIYGVFMPNSGSAYGTVTVNVSGSDTVNPALVDKNIPNMNLVVQSSTGGSIRGTTLNTSTLRSLNYSDLTFTRSDVYPFNMIVNSFVPFTSLSGCSFTGGFRGFNISGPNTIYIDGVAFGTMSSNAFAVSGGARIFTNNLTGSGTQIVSTGAEIVYDGTYLTGTQTITTAGRITAA